MSEMSTLLSVIAGVIVISFSALCIIILIKYLWGSPTQPKESPQQQPPESAVIDLEAIAEILNSIIEKAGNLENYLNNLSSYMSQKVESLRKKKKETEKTT